MPFERYLLGLLAAAGLFGQNPAPTAQATAARPEFEVASIKLSAADEFDRSGLHVHIDGSQVSWNFLSLKDYIGAAYHMKGFQISGPDWLASARFDIVAKMPAGATAKQTTAMLRALLEDRFGIKTHRENKDLAVYGLVVAKGGLKMQESPPDSVTDIPSGGRKGYNVAAVNRPGGVTVNLGNGASYTFADNKFEGTKMMAANMANILTSFMDRPVVDLTNLKGNYDFVLDLSPEDFRAMGIRAAIAAGVSLPPQAIQLAEAASGDSLTSALEKLGLKLEARKAPVEVLVIDHAERMPTDN